MKHKKLNTLTLSGLMIGPIFGSGIILLPPLIFNQIGVMSLFVWVVTLAFGFLFALVFGRLASSFKGDGGISLATKEAMGRKYQILTSWYLIFATLFGPVAVMLIAADFLHVYFSYVDLSLLGFFVYLCAYILLLIRISFLGKIMLIASYGIVLLFLIASVYALTLHVDVDLASFDFNVKGLGYAFLLAFWAVVGWEIVGNYSNEAKDLNSLKKAIILSAIIFSIVYLLINFAIVFGDFGIKNGDFKLSYLLNPIFGNFSNIILLVTSIILCVGTLILFVGATARLITSLNLSSFSSKRLQNGSPIGALNILSIAYIIILLLVYFNLMNLSNLVAIANGFFIANALIGLFSAVILFEKGFLRNSAIFLSIIFFGILLFSNTIVLLVIFGLFIYTYFKPEYAIRNTK